MRLNVWVCVWVCACVSVCVALQEYSIGSEFPNSQYADEDLEKESGIETMEYMDDLKEKVDASITPLSEMNSMTVSDDTPETWFWLLSSVVTRVSSETIEMNYIEENYVEDVVVTPHYVDLGYIDEDKYGVEDSTRTIEIDPYKYIQRKRMQTSTTTTETPTTTEIENNKNGLFQKLPSGRKQKGKIGRPRKTTLFPKVPLVERTTKKRMRWNNEVNKFIMYIYFLVTKLETDMIQYRKKMLDKFQEAYPEWGKITEQRLADQKRSIKQNRLVDIETIREIKRKVKTDLEAQGVVVNIPEDSRDKSFYD